MKRLLIAFVAVLLIPAAIAGAEQIELYGFTSFTPPEEIGTVVTVLCFLEPPIGFDYPFATDFTTNEYTFACRMTVSSVLTTPFSVEYEYADADFASYEDPARDGDYAAGPASFENGTPVLVGTLSRIARSDDAFGFLEPTMIADCVFTGGVKLDELVQGPNWTMHGGLSTDPLMHQIPSGYQQAWINKIFFTGPVSVEDATWSEIKTRGND